MNIMAKPICVIYYLPEAISQEKELQSIHNVNEIFRKMFPDYYTLAIPSNKAADGSAESIELKVFHEKDFTEIQYQELKQLIQDNLNEQKNG